MKKKISKTLHCKKSQVHMRAYDSAIEWQPQRSPRLQLRQDRTGTLIWGGMDGCLCFVRSSNGFLVLTEVLDGTTGACVHENTVNYNPMTSLVVVVPFSTKLRLQNRGDCLAVSLVNAKWIQPVHKEVWKYAAECTYWKRPAKDLVAQACNFQQ